MKKRLNEYIARLEELLQTEPDRIDSRALLDELNEINDIAELVMEDCANGEYGYDASSLEKSARKVLNLVQEVADQNNIVTDDVYFSDDEIDDCRDMMYPNQGVDEKEPDIDDFFGEE